jgi:catechol 2,3-dioxygenase-like lactoylglutathione lyase family enzyme
MSENGFLEQATPILPARDLVKTAAFYQDKLGFKTIGEFDPDYLMMQRDNISIHFFQFAEMDPLKEAGSCYIYVRQIEALYREYQAAGAIHPNGKLEYKPWKMYEFAAIDPDNNLLRIGQAEK